MMTDETKTRKTRPFAGANYDCNLPVYKQGDDLAHYLKKQEEAGGTAADAFEDLALQYDAAAAHCRRMVGLVREVPEVRVSADCHCICVEGPAERLDPLVDQGILSHAPGNDEEIEELEYHLTEIVLEDRDEKGSFLAQDVVARLPELDENFKGVNPAWVGEVLEGMVEEGSLVRDGDGRYRVRGIPDLSV